MHRYQCWRLKELQTEGGSAVASGEEALSAGTIMPIASHESTNQMQASHGILLHPHHDDLLTSSARLR